ncbi:MAG: hypothetical protein HPY45_14675 [Anaerolineae bacterium]|nr:hypothetical protein [Anaerolineae bacterium]
MNEDNELPSLAGCQELLANLMVGEHSARTNSAAVHVIFSHYLAGFLTPTMQAVLNWLITHDASGVDSEGRPSNQRRFSAAQIAAGYWVDGRRVSWGCGCNRGTVIKTLNALEELRIIRRIGDPRRAKKGGDGEYGCLWELQLNFAEWNWDAIQQQKSAADQVNQARAAKARRILEDKRSAAPTRRRTPPTAAAAPSANARRSPTKPSAAPLPTDASPLPHPAPAPLDQLSAASASGITTPPIGLYDNPTQQRSVAQSHSAAAIGALDRPIRNPSVPQSDSEQTMRLSYKPIRAGESVAQTDSMPVLINESVNKGEEKIPFPFAETSPASANGQEWVEYFRWAFSRRSDWRSEPSPLTNIQVREMGEWVAQYGEDALRAAIDEVARYPNPPPLERAFGLVRHTLKKRAARQTGEPLASSALEASPPLPRGNPHATLQAGEEAPGELSSPAQETDALQGWRAAVQRLSAAEISAVQQLRGYLRGEMSRADYETWFAPARLLGRGAQGELIFGLANRYACEWVEDRLGAVIRRFLAGALGGETAVAFCVATSDVLELGR